MEKIKKHYCHLFLLLLSFSCVTIKPNRDLHVLNKNNQKFDSTYTGRTHRKLIEKSKNLTKLSVKDRLKKLKNPKLIFAVGTFIVGTATALTASVAIHAWGHVTLSNYFYPNSAKIEKILPWDVLIDFNSQEINLHKNKNHLKEAAAHAAGPIIGFLGSYGLFKLLAKHNSVKSTLAPFLSGLKFGSKTSCLGNILSLIMVNPDTDGQQMLRVLKKDNSCPPDSKWYHYLINIPIVLLLVEKFFKPDFVKLHSHLFS